jgi:peptidoglycan/xylan/chitin deacetylase (PgdA/CDA1 family)
MPGNNTAISRRSFLKFSLLNLAGLAWNGLAAKGLFGPPEIPPGDEPYPEVIHSIPTHLPYFALTIDDGFDLEALVEIVEIMEEYHFSGTFFMIGRYSIRAEMAYPGIMKRLAETGSELAFHTMTHERPEGGWTVEWLTGDYLSWLDYHKEMLGDDLYQQAVKPYARAPWNNFSRPFLRFCEALDLLPVSWSNDPGSYNRGQEIINGDIFLLHVRQDDLRYIKEFSSEGEIQPVPLGWLIEAEQDNKIARHKHLMK